MHWNLPSKPVDLEQREGRIHRYKGHAVRKNIAERFGFPSLLEWYNQGDPWVFVFDRAVETRVLGMNDIVPYWVFDEGEAKIERRILLLPFSNEGQKIGDAQTWVSAVSDSAWAASARRIDRFSRG